MILQYENSIQDPAASNPPTKPSVRAKEQQKTAYGRFSGKPLDICTDLMNFHPESPANYWQQLATTGLHAHIEMMARFNHLFVGNTKERMEKAIIIFHATLPTISFFDNKIDGSIAKP